ncbi:RNA-binding S4 domain-containing protein [Labedella endophytica]|jgi:ribosome-associated protein|uniref:RNA-binding S4 domain-containing protein n=1 Tax=Labedella endophytica TaxID=1523160 RepID=A0A433JQ29_9MICO|nr:RNA-binding S4 domain-containing protein [Labedella endophytica]RUQ98987.1 RNA-binding S4 domain-containing protein [Labedella endophytica]
MMSREPVEDVPVGSDVIRLGQFLKFSGLLDSGGDAKAVVAGGDVRVNGREERRRGRQLVDGDVVALGGRSVRVRP